MAAVDDGLLHLLYENGDKTKPLSAMVTNPLDPLGALIGRNLGKNSWQDVSEWVSMLYLLASKKETEKEKRWE